MSNLTASRHPRNPHGSQVAIVARRHLDLPPGEFQVITVLVSSDRGKGTILEFRNREIVDATGRDLRTLRKHGHSLEQKGLKVPGEWRATPEAIRREGEQFVALGMLGIMRQPPASVFQAWAVEKFATDLQGVMRRSRSWQAKVSGISVRGLHQRLARAASLGLRIARTFTPKPQNCSPPDRKTVHPVSRGSLKKPRKDDDSTAGNQPRPRALTRRKQREWLRNRGVGLTPAEKRAFHARRRLGPEATT